MHHVLRSLSIASIVGVIAATPIVILFATDSSFLQYAPRLIVVLMALVCPPWQLFWVVMGHPDDLSFVLRVCGAVLVLNAVLYAALGVLHALTPRLRPTIRHALMGVAFICLLVFGHLLFLQEPAGIYALLQPRAA